MEPFITFRDRDKQGELQYYILQRAWPHYVGVIFTYPPADPIMTAAISGYNLFVVYSGTLQGRFLPSNPNWEVEVQGVFQDMATWFHQKRILTEPRRYKKLKV